MHAALPLLEVVVRGEDGTVLASGTGLERTRPGLRSYLLRDGGTIRLEDGWPTDDDLGRLVVLPGGETGTLLRWWNAEDRSEWRWQVEFSNHV